MTAEGRAARRVGEGGRAGGVGWAQKEEGRSCLPVWAVELLGDEPPRDACPELKVQPAALREKPSSTHHPWVQSEGKKGACAWSR